MHDLVEAVHARVRAAGADRAQGRIGKLRERLLQRVLHRALAPQAPAREVDERARAEIVDERNAARFRELREIGGGDLARLLARGEAQRRAECDQARGDIGGRISVGDAAADAKLIDGAMRDLAVITGQKPRLNRARSSIANFKVRENQPIGASVTMRNDRMWEFFDRLVAVAIPRIREQLPAGMELRVLYDRSALVDRTVATVQKNLAEGALLVVAVLLPIGRFISASSESTRYCGVVTCT